MSQQFRTVVALLYCVFYCISKLSMSLYYRNVCVFGLGDFSLLSHRPELYANKFYIDYNPLLYDCMEELLYNKTREEFLMEREFNVSFYANLDQVKNHIHDVRWL